MTTSGTSEDLAARLRDAEQRLAAAAERERVHEEKLRYFQEIGLALASTLNLEPLLDRIVSHVRELLDAEQCLLFILDHNRGELWAKIPQGGQEREIRVRLGEGIVGLVAQSDRGLNLKDARKHPQFLERYDELTGFTTRSLLCQPLMNYQQRIIGVVQVLNKKSGYFTVDDEKLLAAVAAQAAMSVSNSKLYLDAVGKNIELLDTQARLHAKMEELDILFRIEQELTSTDDLDTLLSSIVRHAVGAVPAEVGAVALSEGSFDVVTLCRARESDAERLRLPAGEGVIGRVARTGKGVTANHLERDPELAGVVADRLQREPSSVACVPIVIEGDAVGALAMYNKTGSRRYFNADDEKLLTLIAGQAAKAVERARARESEIKANRLATVGQLLSGVLHDLRGPMSIISGYARLMSLEDDADERADFAISIQKQIRMLDQMTREILAFARGESILLVRKVILSSLLDEMAELLRGEFAARGVELRVEPGYRGPLWVDETKLRRIIFNLARNAREAMPERGRFSIDVREDAATDEIVFRFSDTGAGIPEEIRDDLYGSFVTSGKKEGTGLGLAIVKRIVDEHGGSITFDSRLGEGTVFTIRLPRLGPARGSPSSEDSEEETAATPLHAAAGA